jgi:hypothetical protein
MKRGKMLFLFAVLIMMMLQMAIVVSAQDVERVNNVQALEYKKNDNRYMELSWDKVEGAKGYKVYRKGNASKKWILIKSTSKTSYVVPEVFQNKTIKIRVRAYKKINGKKVYGRYSKTFSYKPAYDGRIAGAKEGLLHGVFRFSSEEAFVLQNKLRKNAGVKALKWSEKLYKVGKVRTKELVTAFGHYRADGKYWEQTIIDVLGKKQYKKYGSIYNFGENAAKGFYCVEDVVEAWKNSSGHYANITRKQFKSGCLVMYIHKGVPYWEASFSQRKIP